MEKPLVSLRKVSKSIDGERILKDISLDIFRGEFVSVVGASGSGKSSLLYILGLIDSPTEGKVFFEGEEVRFTEERRLSRIRNRKLGFVFQFHYLLPEFSTLENVMVPMLKAGTGGKSARERASELLKRVGLTGKENRKPYQLSGGEQQRVAIARALANDPLLILADEPTGNLDSRNTEVVMDIFMELHREGRTIVMVTHEDYLAKRAQRILHMKDGRLM